MTAVVTGVLVGTAALLLLAPGRRPGEHRSGHTVARGAGGARRSRSRDRAAGSGEPDLGVLVMEVATRLRAGAPVEQAWRETFARAGLAGLAGTAGAKTRQAEEGVPPELLELAARPVRRGRRTPPWHHRPAVSPTTAGAVPGTLAACRLTRELGAPLADVLDRCADGLTEAGHAQAARSVALAGPRATARLLGWLPALGLLLGLGVGTDPLAVLLDGGTGSACLVAGLVLMAAGRRWVRALERAAGAAGTSGSDRTRRPRTGRRR